jgi:hypothetical protein
MSNQIDHRAPANQRNRRHNERPAPANSCGGEGHNGQLGTDWKLLSRRNERRNLKQGREASIGKLIKRTKPDRKNSTMYAGVEFEGGKIRRKNHRPRPISPDTGEET